MIYFWWFMAIRNNYINRFVLQELGDITDGVRLVEILIEHIGINEPNYFCIDGCGTFIQSYQDDFF